MNSKESIKIIVTAAKQYDEKLNDKHFLIVYQDKHTIKTVQVGFRDMNFLHLTRVRTKISAQQFYSRCLNGRLSEKDCMIGTFINSGICIKSDYFIGDTKSMIPAEMKFFIENTMRI